MLSLMTLPDTCTAQEAVDLVATLAPGLGIHRDLPDVRTLRSWRTKQYLSVQGRRFTRRNLLEILVVLTLRQGGLTLAHAVERIRTLDETRMQVLLTGSPSMPSIPTDAEPLITLQLLAKGILAQYRQVIKGIVVGHLDRHTTGTDTIPLLLQQAMARLGRHYFMEGQHDQAASVHQLLVLCTTPLHMWAPQVICDLVPYQQAVLIDPVYLVPSEDCESIAEEAEGANLPDLVERYLHEQLRTALTPLGNDADRAYTIIREFIGRHPLATDDELRQLYLNPELPDDTIALVRGLYHPVHRDDAHDGHVRRCAHCAALIGRTGHCRLAGCRAEHSTTTTSTVPVDTARLARPEVLKYWVDPAREELRLYDTLCRHPPFRDRVQLYPHSDWCDVSLDETVGIDVKDYHDPVRLAQRLNRSIGQLSHYPERIIAIAQRRWSRAYRDRLIEQLNPERRMAVQIMSVNQTITHMQQTHGGLSDV